MIRCDDPDCCGRTRIHTTGRFELYDMATDPFQLDNIYSAASSELKAELHSALAALWGCVGEVCP